MSETEAQASPQAEAKLPRTAWVAAAVFALSFLLRLAGIGWGLPNDLHWQSYHPDEPVNLLYAQQIDLAKGDLDPGFYNYPTLYLTVLRVASDMTAAYTGAADPKSEESQWRFLGRATMAGRFLTAAAGAGTAAVVFCLLATAFRQRYGELDGPALFGAIAAGAATGIAPAFLVHSRFATVDVPSTFFFALSLLWALRIATSDEGPLWKTALVGALWCGLAAGTKYNAGIAILPLLASPWLAKRKEAPALNGLMIGVAALTFLATTPGIVTNSAKFMADFQYELGHTASGHGLAFVGTSSGFLYHVQNLMGGYGALLLLVSLAGLVWMVRAKSPLAWIVLLAIVPYYLLIGRAEVKFMRYTFPLVVGLSAGFGYLMGEARRAGGRSHAWVAAGILGLGGLDPGGLRGAASYTVWMGTQDPRDAAARYLKAQNAQSVGLATDPWFYTPALYPNTALPRMAGPEKIFGSMAASEAPRVERYLPEDPSLRGNWDLRLLTETKPQYVVYSSFEERDLARMAKMARVPEPYQGEVDNAQRFLGQLEKDYTLDRQFGVGTGLVEDMEYVQPVIWVWKRKTDS